MVGLFNIINSNNNTINNNNNNNNNNDNNSNNDNSNNNDNDNNNNNNNNINDYNNDIMITKIIRLRIRKKEFEVEVLLGIDTQIADLLRIHISNIMTIPDIIMGDTHQLVASNGATH